MNELYAQRLLIAITALVILLCVLFALLQAT